MNKKFMFNTIFILVGSFIIILLSTIGVLNFFRDARILHNAPVAQEKQIDMGSKTAAEKTVIFKGTPDEKPVKEVKESNLPEPETTDKEKAKRNGIKVEVKNYTELKELTETIKSKLEASGYEVKASNEKPGGHPATMIVERNDKKAGDEIQKILLAGSVVRWPIEKSEYDVSILIGEDFLP